MPQPGLDCSPHRCVRAFPSTYRLDYYDPEILKEIVKRTGRILNLDLKCEEAKEIALRARGTPRIANNLLRWVRDYAQVRKSGRIDAELVKEALALLSIDSLGLEEMDKKILEVIIDFHGGGPVGFYYRCRYWRESDTIEEVHEPFLIMQGFLEEPLVAEKRLLKPTNI